MARRDGSQLLLFLESINLTEDDGVALRFISDSRAMDEYFAELLHLSNGSIL